MSEFKIVLGLCMIGLCMNSYAESNNAPAHPEQAEWGYGAENGPDVWGQLSPEYVLCAEGSRQSPIDLVNATSAKLPAIVFNYQPTSLNIRNNGHTIEVASTAENWIEVDSTRYELLQFHFHAPSEHAIAGELLAMEMHLVHQSKDGTLAVLGVLIERGSDHAAFKTLWAHLPSAPDEGQRIEQVTINADDLLPSVRTAYRYDGSLTTPPCSEGVKWFVLTTPIELSEAQIAAFTAIVHNNNRPVQPLNERELLVDIAEDH